MSAIAVPLGVAAIAVFAVWWLSIPFDQIGSGLIALGKFIALMFPPSTGGHLDLLLNAMGQTLAIAPAFPNGHRRLALIVGGCSPAPTSPSRLGPC